LKRHKNNIGVKRSEKVFVVMPADTNTYLRIHTQTAHFITFKIKVEPVPRRMDCHSPREQMKIAS